MTDAPSPRCSSGTDEAREPFERFIVRAGFTDWTRHEDGYLKPLVDRLWRAWPRGVAQAPSREAREKEITRLATIEECAQICEGHEWTRHATHHSPTKACAIAIRALMGPVVSSTEGNSRG